MIQDYNVAYFQLHEKAHAGPRRFHVSDELNVDMAPDGTIYGIELSQRHIEQLGRGTPKENSWSSTSPG